MGCRSWNKLAHLLECKGNSESMKYNKRSSSCNQSSWWNCNIIAGFCFQREDKIRWANICHVWIVLGHILMCQSDLVCFWVEKLWNLHIYCSLLCQVTLDFSPIYFNPFVPKSLFHYPLKTSESRKFFSENRKFFLCF